MNCMNTGEPCRSLLPYVQTVVTLGLRVKPYRNAQKAPNMAGGEEN